MSFIEIALKYNVALYKLFEYNEIVVETRRYLDNTYYGPLPYDEVYKSEVLKQNYGWE